MADTYEELGRRVGALVDEKNAAYGSAFDDAGEFLRLLYPLGIEPEQYGDALCLVRIFDKMKRIATDKDAFGESPYQDIAGYGLLGLRRVEHQRALERGDFEQQEAPEEAPKQTMGDAMNIQGENPMFPPSMECHEETRPVQVTKSGLNPDQHVRFTRRKGGA